MPILIRSFAKINLGLRIGPLRPDRFHELRTVYQTLALHDLIAVEVTDGTDIEILCEDPRVPTDQNNTCWRAAKLVLKALKLRKKVRISIDKKLPVQGGMGAASSNAVATMLALERVVKRRLAPQERLRIAAEVGSDVPLFLLGGTVLGVGHGEQVYALEDLPAFHCVAATPPVGVSTPEAFKAWDAKMKKAGKLTLLKASAKINEFSHSVYEWLSDSRFTPTGVPDKGWDRAEALLLDLVRAGIENDFESVVFPQYPAIHEVKSVLERSAARYVSLSGSGATVYGLFEQKSEAVAAAADLKRRGIPAQATRTLTRSEYWKKLFPDKDELKGRVGKSR